MAGSCVVNYGNKVKRIRKIVIMWTADSKGDVSYAFGHLNGDLGKVVVIPGEGADQPSSGYNVSVLDAEGLDILDGVGVNRQENYATVLGTAIKTVAGLHTLLIAKAGDSKKGTVVIHVDTHGF